MQYQQSVEPDFLKKAQKAIKTPEIQDILERLSKYGLGVFIPHYHPEQGGFEPLPKDVVALEKNLTITFVSKDDEALSPTQTEEIGWRWDNEEKLVMACHKCLQIGCYHY